jgi:hypothetical protein
MATFGEWSCGTVVLGLAGAVQFFKEKIRARYCLAQHRDERLGFGAKPAASIWRLRSKRFSQEAQMARIVPVVLGCLVTLTVSAVAHGQVLGGLRASVAGEETSSICGASVVAPSTLPPDRSGPVIYMIAPCLPGNLARIPPLGVFARHSVTSQSTIPDVVGAV